MASTDEKKEGNTVSVAKTPAELQRMRLEKLMKNPVKPVFIPEHSKAPKMKDAPEFIRNVWGSSAGAGSGDFHVYRGVRRREYARQKFIAEFSKQTTAEEEYHKKVEENKKAAEEKTAKKRAKRQKKKEKAKNKKMKKETKEEDSSADAGEGDANGTTCSDDRNGDNQSDANHDDRQSDRTKIKVEKEGS